MRWLAAGLVAALALWGVWWWVAAAAMERAAAAWLAGLTAQGFDARAERIGVAGFPARLDLTVTGPALSDPATGTAFEAPFVQVLTLAYRPWHVIAALPPEMTLRTPAGAATLTADRLRASVVAAPRPSLPLDRTAVEGDALRLSLPGGAVVAAALRAGTRADPADPARHTLALALRGLRPDMALPPDAPPGAGDLRVDATLGFSAPLDRFAAGVRLTALDLTGATFDWGSVRVTAAGRLAADAAGFAAGRIEITVDDWPRALSLATAAGLIDPGLAPTWARIAAALSDAARTPGRVALPLVMAGGRVTLGPLPVGAAPRF